MREDCVLAIDQGTTGSTAIVFDRRGAPLGRSYRELTQRYPRPSWVEHDPLEIWRITLETMRDALAASARPPSAVAAIGVTNQRETVVLWDRKTGRPAAPAIVWQDRRTADACERMKLEGLEAEVTSRTGLVLDPYFSATKIAWALDQVEGLRGRAERGEIAFGTIDSWLIWNLTGGRRHVTDYSNASRTMLFNIHTLRWDDDLLALFRVPRAILADVCASSDVLGVTAPGVFPDDREVAIGGVAGDQQAALFGQACFAPGRAKNTYGTGSFVLMNSGQVAPRPSASVLATIAWRLGDAPVVYAMEGSVFVTGAAIQWLRDGLGLISSATETADLARSLSGNDDVYFVPALTGLAAPHWDPYARGMIIGLTRGTSKAHLARAALEAICHQSCDVIEAMEWVSGVKLKELRCDGGAAVNAFLMQFQADLLGVPVLVPNLVESTALGAAYLAGLAVGVWSGVAEIERHWAAASSYAPAMADPARAALRSRWGDAVQRAGGWARERR